MATHATRIPTINIEPLMENSGEIFTEKDRAATAAGLMRACETHGLCFITGHGISADQRKSAFDNARRFFSLPEATKRTIPAKKGGFTRGFIGFGGESGSHLLECKEALSFGYPWPDNLPSTNALQGPNIWPAKDYLEEGWRESMIALFRLMVSVNEAVARGLALCPDLGLQQLPSLCQGGDTISLMRLFHYFPYLNGIDGGSSSGSSGSSASGGGGAAADDNNNRRENGPGKIGSSPHTDWGLSTSIMQDGAGGLQFLEQKTQRWVDVPCNQEDALVFNCGDYLSLLSKGRLKSPVHQVVTTGVERTSFVFFHYPNFDAKLPTAAATNRNCTNTRKGSSPSQGEAAGSTPTAAVAACMHAHTSPPSAAAGAAVEEDKDSPASGPMTIASTATIGIRAEMAVSGPAVAVTAMEVDTKATIGPYNTLLDLRRNDLESDGGVGIVTADTNDVSFGQYLIRKWGAVFRE